MSRAKVVDLETLLALRQGWRDQGQKVVWTNGCFDLLHVGHVRGFQEARGLGDLLVVGVNSDASVRKLKGPGRPIVPEGERAEVLAALGCIDHVLIFGQETPVEVIRRLQPDIHCKGADYAPPPPGSSRRPKSSVPMAGASPSCNSMRDSPRATLSAASSRMLGRCADGTAPAGAVPGP